MDPGRGQDAPATAGATQPGAPAARMPAPVPLPPPMPVSMSSDAVRRRGTPADADAMSTSSAEADVESAEEVIEEALRLSIFPGPEVLHGVGASGASSLPEELNQGRRTSVKAEAHPRGRRHSIAEWRMLQVQGGKRQRLSLGFGFGRVSAQLPPSFSHSLDLRWRHLALIQTGDLGTDAPTILTVGNPLRHKKLEYFITGSVKKVADLRSRPSPEERRRVADLELRMHIGRQAPEPLPGGFGELTFESATSATAARYACLSSRTDVRQVVSLLRDCWKLPTPSALISVTGSAQEMKLEPVLDALIRQGLEKVVSCTDAWVTTGGTDTGVMALVGSTLRPAARALVEHLTPLIGFAAYGGVMHHHRLLSMGRAMHYTKTRPNSRIEAALDPHHTHFVLVDDGTRHKFGGEIAMRASVEHRICEELAVPGVQLVVQGGPGTFRTMVGSLQYGIPVVLVQDSGGAAQTVAEVAAPLLDAFRNGEYEADAMARRRRVEARLEEKRPWVQARWKQEQLADVMEQLLHILSFIELLHIFSFSKSEETPFDVAVLQALVSYCRVNKATATSEEAQRQQQPVLFRMRPASYPLHFKARDPLLRYPPRLAVPDECVSWASPWTGPCSYQPSDFTHVDVLPAEVPLPSWADPAEVSREMLQDRRTFCCTAPDSPHRPVAKRLGDASVAFESTGRPLNPRGRTGLRGRGLLGKWGANLEIDPIITRFHPKRNKLQMAAVQRPGGPHWAIPGHTCRDDEDPMVLLSDAIGNAVETWGVAEDDFFSVVHAVVEAARQTETMPGSKQAEARAGSSTSPPELAARGSSYAAVVRTTESAPAVLDDVTARGISTAGSSSAAAPSNPSSSCNCSGSSPAVLDAKAAAPGAGERESAKMRASRKVSLEGAPAAADSGGHYLQLKGLRQIKIALRMPKMTEVQGPGDAEAHRKQCERAIRRFERSGRVIYAGYVDDPRNTDNAWVETFAVHYHCPNEAASLVELELNEAQPNTKVTWLDIDEHESRFAHLYASHMAIANIAASALINHRLALRPYPEYQVRGYRRQGLLLPYVGWTSLPPPGGYKPAELTVSDTEESTPLQLADELSSRLTHLGPIFFDPGGAPLNPRGRTGLRGRGVLRAWGPNHRVHALVSRVHPVTRKLQVVVVQHAPDKSPAQPIPWDFPSADVQQAVLLDRERLCTAMLRCFRDSAFSIATPGSKMYRFSTKIYTQLEQLFRSDEGKVLYRGYDDDMAATDNAWFETTAMHFHCPFELGSSLLLFRGAGCSAARWIDIEVLTSAKGLLMKPAHIRWVEDVEAQVRSMHSGLLKMAVRWGEPSMVELVLRDDHFAAHRSPAQVASAFHEALARGLDPAFDVRIIDQLIMHGARAKEVDFCRLFDDAGEDDPFNVLRRIRINRTYRYQERLRQRHVQALHKRRLTSPSPWREKLPEIVQLGVNDAITATRGCGSTTRKHTCSIAQLSLRKSLSGGRRSTRNTSTQDNEHRSSAVDGPSAEAASGLPASAASRDSYEPNTVPTSPTSRMEVQLEVIADARADLPALSVGPDFTLPAEAPETAACACDATDTAACSGQFFSSSAGKAPTGPPSPPKVGAARNSSMKGHGPASPRYSVAGKSPKGAFLIDVAAAVRPRDLGLWEYTTDLHPEPRLGLEQSYPVTTVSAWHDCHVPMLSKLVPGFERYAHNSLAVDYFDLMLWALCCGAVELAETLWKRTRTPLRAALIAQAFGRNVIGGTQLTQINPLDVQLIIDRFEELAVGVLESLPSREAARRVLLADDSLSLRVSGACNETPYSAFSLLGMPPGAQTSSLLHVAIELDCMSFIAHRYCQGILDELWCGRTAQCGRVCFRTIPSYWRVALQIVLGPLLLRVVRKVCNDRWIGWWTEERLDGSRFDRPKAAPSDKQLTCDLKEWTPTARPGLRPPLPGSFSGFRSLGLRRRSSVGTTLRSLEVDKADTEHLRKRAIEGIEEVGAHDRITVVHDLLGFFLLPIAKRTLNALQHVIYTAMVCSSLAFGKLVGPLTAQQMVTYYWTACVAVYHVYHFTLSTRIWLKFRYNYIDLIALIFMFVACGLRLSLQQYGDSDGPNPAPKDRLEALRTMLAIAVGCLMARFAEALSKSFSTGVFLLMIYKMFGRLVEWGKIMLMFAAGSGLALSILVPEDGVESTWSGVSSAVNGVFFVPFWAIFDMYPDPELLAVEPYSSGASITPVFIWIYLLVSLVMFVNLLIAAFSETYEEVSAQAIVLWRMNRVHQLNWYMVLYPFPVPLAPVLVLDVLFTSLTSFRRCRSRGQLDSPPERSDFRESASLNKQVSLANIAEVPQRPLDHLESASPQRARIPTTIGWSGAMIHEPEAIKLSHMERQAIIALSRDKYLASGKRSSWTAPASGSGPRQKRFDHSHGYS